MEKPTGSKFSIGLKILQIEHKTKLPTFPSEILRLTCRLKVLKKNSIDLRLDYWTSCRTFVKLFLNINLLGDIFLSFKNCYLYNHNNWRVASSSRHSHILLEFGTLWQNLIDKCSKTFVQPSVNYIIWRILIILHSTFYHYKCQALGNNILGLDRCYNTSNDQKKKVQ